MSGFSVRKAAGWAIVLSLFGSIGYVQYNQWAAGDSPLQSSTQRVASQNTAIASNMEKLMAGQEGTFAVTGRYSSDLNALPVHDRDTRINVEVVLNADASSYVMIAQSQSGQYAYASSVTDQIAWSAPGELIDTPEDATTANLTVPVGVALPASFNH